MRALFLLLLLPALSYAGVDDLAVSYPEETSPQAVVVKFTSNDCPPCRRLAPKLTAATPANYKTWEFVAENQEHAKWFRDWRVTQYPTVFIMSPDGYTLATIIGDKSEEELRAVFAQAASKLAAKSCSGAQQATLLRTWSVQAPGTCQGGNCSAGSATIRDFRIVQSAGSCPTCPK